MPEPSTPNGLRAEIGADGRVDQVHFAGQHWLGWSSEEMLGSPVQRFLDPHGVNELHVRPSSSGHPDFRLQGGGVRLRASDGSYHRFDLRAARDGAGWAISGRPSEPATDPQPDLWASVADVMDERIAVLDGDGEIVAVNAAWHDHALSHGMAHDFRGESYLAVCDRAAQDPFAREAAQGLREVLDRTSPDFTMGYPFDGRHYLMRARLIRGHPAGQVVVVHDDVTDEHAKQRRAEEWVHRLDELGVAIVSVDAADRIREWNQGAERILGWTREEVVGGAASEVLVEGESTPAWASALTLHPNERLVTMRRKDGSALPVRHRVTEWVEGAETGSLNVLIDSSAEARALREVEQGRKFLEIVTDSMGEGLVVLDAGGTVILMNEAAERMLGWTQPEIVGEILHEIIHHRYPDGSDYPADACPITTALRGELLAQVADDTFIQRDGRPLPVSYTAAPLDRKAGGCVVLFTDATQLRAEERRLRREVDDLTSSLRIREAVRTDRLALFQQPIVDLSTDEVVTHELLLRVESPDGRLVGPVSFLAEAERLGLSGAVDRWVVRRGIELAATGRSVELNLSGASLNDVPLLGAIEKWIVGSGAAPDALVFEITETALVADEEAGRRFVAALRGLGCRIALDDFGTGYGGFTYLKHLAVDILKIDIEFVRDLVTNEASRHVVHSIVELARNFGLQTVAEGVEDAATLELLRAMGVDHAQGFYLGMPAPVDLADTRTTTTEMPHG